MNETFIIKKFRAATLEVIDQAVAIIKQYQAEGYDLTLRQLYYQFVARDLIPNHQKQYDRLGRIISDARLAGLIDWDAIVDRGRKLKGHKAHGWCVEGPGVALQDAARLYKEDVWVDQEWRIEVWVEKEALVGVLERVCNRYRVDYFACKGYVSQSALYEAGQRYLDYSDGEQKVLVVHLADHDPSGIDMTRDNLARLDMFSYGSIELIRIALNMDQVELYDPPPNPAKEDDSRFEDYWRIFGDKCWELDALEPSTIASLIEDAIEDRLNPDLMDEALAREKDNRRKIKDCSVRWDEVKDFLNSE